MLKNIIKLTLRNLLKNSLYTSINILGLTIGITVFLSILTLVNFENSYNKKIPGSDHIYRIYTRYSGVFSGQNRGISNGIPSYLKENFTGINEVAQIHTWSANVTIPQNDGSMKELDRQSDLVIASPSLFRLIKIWQWEAGDIKSMEDPNSVTLLRSRAEQYFGILPSSEYLGRQIIYRDSLPLQVVGIVSDPDGRTDFSFTDFISAATIESSFLKENYDFTDWGSTSSSNQLFIGLNENAGLQELDFAIDGLNEEKKMKSEDDSWETTYHYQPLADLHYDAELGVFDNTSHAANTEVLRNLMFIALAILLIAIINFINLETAIGGKRGREIGIRKVMGSSRKTVILQFLVQSTLMTLLAVILAVPLTQLSLQLFESFLPQGVVFEPFEYTNLLMLLAIVLIVGVLSGFYPALVMSAFSPVKVLKSNTPTGQGSKSAIFLRKGLTIFQFAFSQVLLIVTFIIFNQIDFVINKDLGFETDNILYFSTPYYQSDSKREVLENELNRISGIDKVLRYQSAPLENGYSSNLFGFTREDGTEIETEVFMKSGDSTFIEFFGIEQLSGRKLRREKEVLINETYMRELGFNNPDRVVGVMIDPEDDSLIVAGVIKDFHIRSLHNEIKPMVFYLDKGSQFALKFSDPSNNESTIASIEKAYSEVYPDDPFESRFFQDSLKKVYQSEERTSRLLTSAAVLALLISCLGLFGLSSFMAIQRTKEIGIRKVNGASIKNIFRLLTTDFLILVVSAIVLAVPVAWWLGETWLESFAYRAPFNIWIFLSSGIIAIMIAFLTVSYHAISAANVNPVTSLRAE